MSAMTVGSPLSPVDFDLGTWDALVSSAFNIPHFSGNFRPTSNEKLFHVTILGFSHLSIYLSDPSNNINLQVIYDANGDAIFGVNDEVPVTLQAVTNSDSKTALLSNLAPGSYYLYFYRINTAIETPFSLSYSAMVGATTVRSSILRLGTAFLPIDADFGIVSPSSGEWQPSNGMSTHTALLSSLVGSERLYRIRLLAIADLSINISGLRQGQNVEANQIKGQVIRDTNNTGVFEVGDDIVPFFEHIYLPNLGSGTYYIHVGQVSPNIEIPFSITVSYTVAPAPSGEQGTSLANAIEIAVPFGRGALNTYTGMLSINQKSQFYKVHFSESGVFRTSLIADNADIWLIQDKDNNRIVSAKEILSWKWAKSGVYARIERFLDKGIYYLKISSYKNDTAQYTFDVSFLPTTNNPQKFLIDPSYDNNFNQQAQTVVQQAIDFWKNAIYWLEPDPSKQRQIPQNFKIQFRLDPTLGDSANGGSSLNNNTVMNAEIKLGRPIVDRINRGDSSNLGLLIHEIGHTFWLAPSLPSNLSFVSNLFSTNSSEYKANTYAGRVYGEILKRGDHPTAIPVQGGGHWAEDVFGNETMTPESNQVKDALSFLSLAALMDLDWNLEVNLSAAQPYVLPQPGPSGALMPIETDNKQQLLFFNGGVAYPGASGYAGSQVSAATPSKFYVINLAQPGLISLTLSQSVNISLTGFSPEENNKIMATMRLLSAEGQLLETSQNQIAQNVTNAGNYYIEVYAGFVDKNGHRWFGRSNYSLQFRIS